jgi:hypothetical protein
VLEGLLDPIEINKVLAILITGLFTDETVIERANLFMRVDADTVFENLCDSSVRTLQL